MYIFLVLAVVISIAGTIIAYDNAKENVNHVRIIEIVEVETVSGPGAGMVVVNVVPAEEENEKEEKT